MTNVYSDYANKTRSSKLVLCHLEATQRATVFANPSGNTYTKSVSYFVIDVLEDGTSLTEASSSSVTTGEWYFDALTNTLYLNCSDDANPNTHTIRIKYRLFFSNRPIDLPYDLSSGDDVHYHGLLKSNSPIKRELDDEQIGIMLETSTNINFENTHGYFDDFYDVLIFENQAVQIYSWSEILPLSEKKKLFDGVIQNKSFTTSQVSFSCKDFTYTLREPISYTNFSSSDGDVPERYLNTPKRRLFGQFKQLQCVPTDATLDGFNLTGTVLGAVDSSTITGTGTSFLSELSPQDEIIYTTTNETKKYTILSVESDTSATLSETLDASIPNASVKVKPFRPYRGKNRNWHIAGHKLRSPSTTVSAATQANRFTASDVSDLFAGDLIKVDGENAFIKRISGSNIVLTANLQAGIPSVSDTIVKNPISKVYINGSEVFIDRDWTVSNGANDAILQIDSLAEFNVAPIQNIPVNLTFTNSSRSVTVSGLDFRTEVQTRDWIRSDDVSHTTWYEVLEVKENEILLRTAYAGGNTTTNAQKKNVSLLDDDAIVTVNCVGQERSSAWVKTASDAVKDLLENDAGLSNINTSSFTDADADSPYTLSYAIPSRIGGSIKSIKDVISDINKSVFGSLVIDGDFNLKYQILTPEKPTDLEALKDDDIVGDFSVRSRNEIVRKVNAKYSPFVDKFTGEDSFELYEFTSELVDDLIGLKSEMDILLHLFNASEAQEMAQRYALYNSLSQSTVTLKGKLNLALNVLNDKIWLNLDRLYKRFGNQDRRKIGIINAISNDGENVTIRINDLGNSFSRGAVVSESTASDFSSATDDEKILSSYITDATTLTPDTTSDKELYQNLIC